MHNGTSRRVFIGRAAAVAGFLTAGPGAFFGAEARAQGRENAERTLGRIAYLLFPHPALGNAPYLRVAAGIAANARTAPLIEAGLAELDGLQPGDWLEKAEDEQLADLQAIESGPFFQAMLAETRVRLYNDREVWDFLGYGGSSMQFGGYIDRGLNDIDWLGDV